ncbi:hypothetical protein EHI42_22040 [Rhizobium hidalgonense]|nr:hypothetical protein EHI42_22040 [Rhizobium hidalgonense]
MSLYAVHPPLSCRTSPPQGRRLARRWITGPSLPSRSNSTVVVWGNRCAYLISPLVGEMSGRTEGGATHATPDILPRRRPR